MDQQLLALGVAVKLAYHTDGDDRAAEGRAFEHVPEKWQPLFRKRHAREQEARALSGSVESGCARARRGELDDLLTAVGATRDGRAFSVLFHHFRPRVQAQLVRLGLGPAAAEDLTQDVMETIWQKAHLYDRSRSAAITWVFQIARNRRIDVKRRSRECCVPAEDFFTIPDPSVACDEHLDARQRQDYVRNALGALPQEQLALVKLAFFEGLSHSAIARELGLPLGTVKSRLRLACARLQRLLADNGLSAAC
jgi:RNA polymerase sigma factor (sigma-70 family)